MEFKDLFSNQATDYKKFRPHYPKDLFTWISDKAIDNHIAWDCGTGNGQAAQALVQNYQSVIATDPSQAQLDQAIQNPNIHYRKATAENSTLSPHSVSTITVAQAFHWFDHEKFYQEVHRVAQGECLLVVWTYSVAHINPAVDALTDRLYSEILNGYWEPERKFVDDGYKSISVPFEELFVPKFQMKEQWSLEQWMGYLQTWSALQTYSKKNQTNPLEALFPEFQKVWGSKPTQTVEWPLSVRAFRVR